MWVVKHTLFLVVAGMPGLRCRRLKLRCIVHYFDFLAWRGAARRGVAWSGVVLGIRNCKFSFTAVDTTKEEFI